MIELPKFSSNVAKRLEFYKNNNITEIKKFYYLLALLEGVALESLGFLDFCTFN